MDAERAAFVWKIFSKDVGLPLNQDMIINTGEISIENTTELVLAVLGKKFGVLKEPPVISEKPTKPDGRLLCPAPN